MTSTPRVLVRQKRGPKPIDRAGLRVGRLVVVDEAPRGANGKAAWNCVCDCGNTCVVGIKSLIDGLAGRGRRSCGCMIKDEYASRRARNAGREIPTTKKCLTCDFTGPLTDFYRDKPRFDGRCPYCKDCCAAMGRERYLKDPATHNEKGRRWHWENRERVLAHKNAYAERNRERRRAADAAWRAANPEIKRLKDNKRRARLLKAGGQLSPGITARLLKLQRGKCACCGKPLGKKFHLDHIVPLALGGPNVDSNIQLLRPRCNIQKHSRHPIDFMQMRGKLL